jgi:uncharacterized protein (TIGR02599 family)
MKMSYHISAQRRIAKLAFSLIEMLVALGILSVLSVVIFTILNQTTQLWQNSEARIKSFQSARVTFDSLARNIGQATLQTYWDYDSTNAPTTYVRMADLHFISGQTTDIISGGNKLTYPTHAVFFQAPLGYSYPSSHHLADLNSLMNVCGYYIEWNSDTNFMPGFLQTQVQPRMRYRLMQVMQPTQDFKVYNAKTGTDWITFALSQKNYIRPVAENIVAMVLEPQNSSISSSTPVSLTTNYSYSSRPSSGALFTAPNQPKTEHQLPPLVKITLVAIDERSMSQWQQQHGNSAPDLGLSGLFAQTANYDADIQTLQDNLKALKMNYRVFNTTVSIQASQWSDN